MGCFSSHKAKKWQGSSEKPVNLPDPQHPAASVQEGHIAMTPPGEVRLAPPSFKGRVKAIQNAQRFIRGNPRMGNNCSSSMEDTVLASTSSQSAPSSASLGFHSATELGLSLFDIAASYSTTAAMNDVKPMPLPCPKPSGYPLPHPDEQLVLPSDVFPTAANPSKGKVFPSEHQPLSSALISFSYAELAAACGGFSPNWCIEQNAFLGSVKLHNGKTEKNQEILVLRLCEKWKQDMKDWLLDMSSTAQLQNPYLCKFLGYCAEDGSAERMLVYEKLERGSLENLLFRPANSLDWPTRMNIAVGAAQGLANLHDKCSEQVMYREFRTSYIQVDMDYSAKIWGFWVFGSDPCTEQSDRSTYPRANAYCAPETVSCGEVSLKSNVWSYGIVLLELMTGRQNVDVRVLKEGKPTLVKWAKPFLMDEGKLFLIMDPKLQGRFPAKGSKLMANLVLQCLQKDPVKRPEMRKVLNVVKAVYAMWYTSRFSSKEAETLTPVFSAESSILCSARANMLYDKEKPVPDFDSIDRPPLGPLAMCQQPCVSGLTHRYDSSGPLECLRGL